MHHVEVDTAAGIIVLTVSIAAPVAVALAFVWAARKDGAEDEAVQRRLGVERRSRLGR